MSERHHIQTVEEEKKPLPPFAATEIRFSRQAWLKLRLWCAEVDREVGGFGLTLTQDPLGVNDVVMIKHESSVAGIEFDDEDLADYTSKMHFDEGLQPDQFRRIWWHTHPGTSAEPSNTDWKYLDEHFETVDWAVMFIMAKGGNCKAILRVRALQFNHQQSLQRPFWIDKELKVVVHGKEGQTELGEIGMKQLAELPLLEWKREIDEKSKEKSYVSTNHTTYGGIGQRGKAKKKKSGVFLRSFSDKSLDALGDRKVLLFRSLSDLAFYNVMDPTGSSENRPDGSWKLWGGAGNKMGENGAFIPPAFWSWYKPISEQDKEDIRALKYNGPLKWDTPHMMYSLTASDIRTERRGETCQDIILSDAPNKVDHPNVLAFSRLDGTGAWIRTVPTDVTTQFCGYFNTHFNYRIIDELIEDQEWDHLELLIAEAQDRKDAAIRSHTPMLPVQVSPPGAADTDPGIPNHIEDTMYGSGC